MPSLAAMPRKAPLANGAAMTNLAAPPIPRTPLQQPNLPPSPQAPGFQFQPPSIGAAPTPTATPAFQAPVPGQLSQAGQFRIDQGIKARQRTAFARGIGLQPGVQMEMERYAQGVASEEADNDYRRALQTYEANRGTDAQDFGQNLASYSAGTGATLDAGRLNLAGTTAGYDRAYGAQRDAYGDQRDAALMQTDTVNANQRAQDEFAALMESYRAQEQAAREADVARQNEATSAMQRRPMGRSLGYRQPYVLG